MFDDQGSRNPMFRSKFSEDIFNHKYAHEGSETWSQLARTLVTDVCGDLLPQSEQDQLVEYISDLKFIPGGRYLYYAGRPNKYFNNCFGGETNVLTDLGWVNLASSTGQTVNVLSPVDGKFYPATIHAHGKQMLRKIRFASIRGHQKEVKTVRATTNHRWLLENGQETYHLSVGDVVPANVFEVGENPLGFVHGMVFGDGNKNGQLRLCGAKADWLDVLTPFGTVTYPESAEGDPVMYFNQKIDWKSVPDASSTPDYIASFIRGWLVADGSETTGNKLCSINREALHWFREHAAFAGIVISGQLRSQKRDVQLGEYSYKDHEIFIQSYAYGRDYPGFKVISIEDDIEEEVFCPFEPVHNQIVIDHNIRTFQCYLFRSEEDSREDWANLSWKVENALMTGGGIGNDYSVYRPEGAPISRTGGKASGPLPKMQMINEIGRRVMQGGSRRSAIYASLDRTHPDIWQFLVSKNWDQMMIGKTGYSYWDVKQQDFNFPAPLDMTNISVNYKTDWLEVGAADPVFRKNVEQALRTAEPGFSFNFWGKENETLRNACTEVTSEDDSDVCNLGSLNLGRIESSREFEDVVDLATRFLVCGTLKAQLPFEKVYRTREKNRRLGLGLMGVHEWLLKRGYRYEVTPELRTWLGIWQNRSDRTSKVCADALSISRPVANRAIAPTGTIGILAGTTTGIEPLFAVAYKRRYLKGQSDWHYQYVVDGTAQELIDVYGLDPEKIESAGDLALDYERRIRFQADVQDFVDQAISSTINLPAWGSEHNNEDTVGAFANTLALYAPRLRGFTCYPDGARGGQPLTHVSYHEAKNWLGVEFSEAVQMHDICDISGKGGSCGV